MSELETVRLPLAARELPPPGRVESWLVDLSAFPLEPGPSGDGRRERVVRRRIRQRFVLRLILAAYLGCPGKDIVIERSERGKPRLAAEHAGHPLRFSLSHTGDFMALAIARDHDPGIDIERERGLPRAVDLARRFLSAEEAEWIAGLEPAGRASAFLRQWTAREALVKAQGCGLAGALAGLAIDTSAPIIRRLPPGWSSPERWRLVRLPLPDGLVGHLALAGRLDGVESVRLDPAVAVE